MFFSFITCLQMIEISSPTLNLSSSKRSFLNYSSAFYKKVTLVYSWNFLQKTLYNLFIGIKSYTAIGMSSIASFCCTTLFWILYLFKRILLFCLKVILFCKYTKIKNKISIVQVSCGKTWLQPGGIFCEGKNRKEHNHS